MSSDIQKSARHIIGPTGYNFSSAWDRMAEGSNAFVKSFDPRIPPSIFVSERDRTRLNHPVPLPERLISGDPNPLTDEELAWGSTPPPDEPPAH